jgi:Flp pilus assembly protein TadD
MAITAWRYRNDAVVAAAPRSGLRSTLQQALVAHPFDAVRAAQLATEARFRRQPREALQWANRAINVWPTLPAGHLEAARALVVTGHLEQAMLEYREAAVGTDAAAMPVLAEAFSRTPDPLMRRRAMPDTAWAQSLLCRSFVKEKRHPEARACTAELARRPDATAAQRLAPLQLALADGDVEATRRAMAEVEGQALDEAELRDKIRAAVLGDGLDAALPAIRGWLRAATRPGPALTWLLGEQLRRGQPAAARETAEALRPLLRTVDELDAFERAECALLEQTGAHTERLAVLRRLVARHPSDVELLAALGLCELKAGEGAAARRTWSRIRALGGQGPAVSAFTAALAAPP